MRSGHLFFSAIQALLITLLFGGAVLLFGLHLLPESRQGLISWILSPTPSFLFLGVLVSGLALMLTICFWAMQKGGFIRVQMKERTFVIEEKVVRKGVEQFWKEHLPECPPPSDVYVAQQKIEVISPELEEHHLEEVEERLAIFFREKFGYENRFYLTLTRN